jgi:flagellar biosynthesis/type III secretory pathway chaperone
MELSGDSTQDLRGNLTELVELSQALCEILLAERAALTERSPQALAEALDRKAELCRRIERSGRALGTEALTAQIASRSGREREVLEPLHKSLLIAAETAREYNAVNGKIVKRSQQSVRELIHLISGMDAELLYGEQGQTLATAQGTAIARA